MDLISDEEAEDARPAAQDIGSGSAAEVGPGVERRAAGFLPPRQLLPLGVPSPVEHLRLAEARLGPEIVPGSRAQRPLLLAAPVSPVLIFLVPLVGHQDGLPAAGAGQDRLTACPPAYGDGIEAGTELERLVGDDGEGPLAQQPALPVLDELEQRAIQAARGQS